MLNELMGRTCGLMLTLVSVACDAFRCGQLHRSSFLISCLKCFDLSRRTQEMIGERAPLTVPASRPDLTTTPKVAYDVVKRKA
jgi:hypothetical protein